MFVKGSNKYGGKRKRGTKLQNLAKSNSYQAQPTKNALSEPS